jgi:hypothetical protein
MKFTFWICSQLSALSSQLNFFNLGARLRAIEITGKQVSTTISDA